MNQPQQIQISGPVKLVHQPQHIQLILQALAELPFKLAQPVISDMERQLLEMQPKPGTPANSAD